MMVNIVWRRSGRDKQVHAFAATQIIEVERGYLKAVCSHITPPAALEPTGHMPNQDTCTDCLHIVGGRSAGSVGDAGRHGPPPP